MLQRCRFRQLVRVASVLTVVACLSTGCNRTDDWRPPANFDPTINVVLITLDTTRADHLGCYGYDKPVSPRIDRFAAQSTIFERAVCSAAVTPVSHASILTGQHPYRHGLRVLHGLAENRLPDAALTLTEILRSVGYRTAAFISAFPAGSRFGLHQGFETFDETFMHDELADVVDGLGAVNTGDNQRRAGDTTDLALQWLDRTDTTFFLWLHYFDPHDAQLLPPREFLSGFKVPVGTERDRLRALYDIEIRYMDQQIGRVFDALERDGRLEESLIIIVSDHGEGLGDHDWWTHGILYEEQIHAPLIIHAPDRPSGRRVNHLVRTIDVMPTVLDVIGMNDHPATLDGRSLAAMLEKDVPDPGLTAYADSVNMLNYVFAPGIADRKDDMLFCVTDGTWKYIHHLNRPKESELYDLTRDRREQSNLIASRPGQVKRLLADLLAREFMPELAGGPGSMSPEDIARLKSVGYSQ